MASEQGGEWPEKKRRPRKAYRSVPSAQHNRVLKL
jgi:hypothetical protein